MSIEICNYNTTAGDVALLQIYADPAGTSTNPNGATLQSVLFNNPSNADGNFDFTHFYLYFFGQTGC
jgi:hypothetical protein